MAGAAWSEETQETATTFSRNESLKNAEDNAKTYNDSSTDYSSSTVYYNGYDPTGITPEGEVGAIWERVSE